MSGPNPNRKSKGVFQDTLYKLRTERGYTHRKVAEAIGVALNTYSNVEAQPHRVISDAKVEKLCDFYRLSSNDRKFLLKAAAALPLSVYTESNRESWRKRNELRSKARRFEAAIDALEELVSELSAEMRPCSCPPVDFENPEPPPCGLCRAMKALGVPDGYVDPETAVRQLGELAEKRAAKQAADEAARQPRTP